MTANSTEADTGRRLRALEDALYNLQRERRDPGSTLDNCPTGMVAGFLSSIPPQGWLPLDGSFTITAVGWPSLYAYLTANGLSLTLPDYRNRFPVGAGGLYTSTSTGGSADSDVLVHTHTIPARYTFDDVHHHAGGPGGGGFVAEQSDDAAGDSSPVPATGATGNPGTGTNLPPYRGLYWMIRT